MDSMLLKNSSRYAPHGWDSRVRNYPFVLDRQEYEKSIQKLIREHRLVDMGEVSGDRTPVSKNVLRTLGLEKSLEYEHKIYIFDKNVLSGKYDTIEDACKDLNLTKPTILKYLKQLGYIKTNKEVEGDFSSMVKQIQKRVKQITRNNLYFDSVDGQEVDYETFKKLCKEQKIKNDAIRSEVLKKYLQELFDLNLLTKEILSLCE